MVRGRPRQFDTEEALEQAMLVFWRRGYRGTSLDDLTEALNINRPSLYAAFGDKETLFLRVIDHYRKTRIVPSAVKLLQSASLKDGLQNFFSALCSLVTGGENPPGCMVACLLADECCESEAIKAKLTSVIEAADRNFTKLFQEHGAELTPVLSAEAAAKLMLSTVHGLSIRARSGASKGALEEVGHSFMKLILVA